MAVNAYEPPVKWSIEAVNYKLAQLKLFNDVSAFAVSEGCRAFGFAIDRGPIIPMIVDEALAKNELVIIGIDYKPGSSSLLGKSDHFVLFFATDQKGNYLAANPGDGSIMRFDKVTISRVVAGRTWKACEMIVLKKLDKPGVLNA